ncbi:MAG: prolyl-tRNA synthetase [Candidatus Sungbacteria bacterium]|nr:prolyl-tRNA synthetase [Candidatus Sungbacteria bacterium]
MRQSILFGKTLRKGPKDEISKNANLLVRGGFVAKEIAGIYSFLPLGLRVLDKIARIIRGEMNDVLGAQEILMPALHPIENYQKTGREKIDVLFHTELASGGKLVLGQSHEEIVVPLAKHFISSYRDLPLGLYQIQTKFRNELRAKSGMLRGREFMMKDLYSFHADENDFEKYYERAKIAYKDIFEKAGLGGQTYLTFASGGTFSKYSHEFQTITEAGEDTIYLCKECKIAINDEIIGEQKNCPQCNAPIAKLLQEKAIEVGNIFPLKTRFSDAFGLSYIDKSGQTHPVVMGCYGIGLGRVLGAIVEVHNDKNGIIWPESVAPYKVHLIELRTKNLELSDDPVRGAAEKLYNHLLAKGIEVLYDDRDDKTAGEKFTDADLIGIPWRVVISEKTVQRNAIEVKKRDSPGSELMSVVSFLQNLKVKM